jgi:hypothetical protein
MYQQVLMKQQLHYLVLHEEQAQNLHEVHHQVVTLQIIFDQEIFNNNLILNSEI